jgi:hypothetical protein
MSLVIWVVSISSGPGPLGILPDSMYRLVHPNCYGKSAGKTATPVTLACCRHGKAQRTMAIQMFSGNMHRHD